MLFEIAGLERKLKARARAFAAVYTSRGLLEKKPCENCGATENIQRHHEDYDRPLDVIWLCSGCHIALHNSRGHIRIGAPERAEWVPEPPVNAKRKRTEYMREYMRKNPEKRTKRPKAE